MNEQDHKTEPTPATDARRTYTAPRLMVHGTVQTLTLGTSGVDGTSGIDDT